MNFLGHTSRWSGFNLVDAFSKALSIVFKYLILILRKEKYILGRIWLIFLGFGETLNYFRALGSKGKLLLGDEEIIFRDLGRSNHYFQGSRENRTPWGLISYLISILSKIVNARKKVSSKDNEEDQFNMELDLSI